MADTATGPKYSSVIRSGGSGAVQGPPGPMGPCGPCGPSGANGAPGGSASGAANLVMCTPNGQAGVSALRALLMNDLPSSFDFGTF